MFFRRCVLHTSDNERKEDVPVLEGEEEWAQKAVDEGLNALQALAQTLADTRNKE